MKNELYDKFYEQSKEIHHPEWSDDAGVTYINLHTFADLIINECIQLVEDHYWSDPHEVYEAMDLIRDHFGVKE